MAKPGQPFLDPHFDAAHGVLKNIPGFTKQDDLDRFERIQATKAIVNLQAEPVNGTFDSAHLKQIHKQIFGAIYPWAGEFRRVNISRPASYPFAVVQFMEKNLDLLFAKLAAENHLEGLDVNSFAGRAAYYLGELNTIHPLREGNGRTQREFIRELAAKTGYRINWNRVTREQMIDASIESHNLGRNAGFVALISSAIEPIRQP
jgi:cell filamentation protein